MGFEAGTQEFYLRSRSALETKCASSPETPTGYSGHFLLLSLKLKLVFRKTNLRELKRLLKIPLL